MATIDFSEYKVAIEKRKKIAKMLADLGATQRATGKMMGVDHKTITKDLQSGENSPKSKLKPAPIRGKGDFSGENSPNPFAPPEIMQSGKNAAKDAEG